jgi:ankyrin repeat protein
MRVMAMLLAVMLAVNLASPAVAQFSESYNFLKAVRDKDGAKATEILDKPGNTVVNTRDTDTGETALHITTRRSDPAWTGFLLQKGASPNSRDREGNTPLMLATQARWAEGVGIFLLVKAQVDLQNRIGETALQKAVQNRDLQTAKQLIEAGANPDITDSSGASARSLAESDPRSASIAKLMKDLPVRKARPAQGPSI